MLASHDDLCHHQWAANQKVTQPPRFRSWCAEWYPVVIQLMIVLLLGCLQPILLYKLYADPSLPGNFLRRSDAKDRDINHRNGAVKGARVGLKIRPLLICISAHSGEANAQKVQGVCSNEGTTGQGRGWATRDCVQ